MKKQIVKGLLVVIFIIISGSCYSCGQKPESESISLLKDPVESMAAGGGLISETAESAVLAESAGTEPAVIVCYVYICGAVHQAGVYEVPEGERIFRVVELAGGYTEDAAEEYLNLAAPVADGMKLFVPTKAELEASGSAAIDILMSEDGGTAGKEPAAGSKQIDLNKAGKEELMTLTGIGAAKADAIIRYRQENGRFNTVEEIMNISGIKQAAFDKIKDNIVVTE